MNLHTPTHNMSHHIAAAPVSTSHGRLKAEVVIDDVLEDSVLKQTKSTIKSQSPFTAIFAENIPELSDDESNDSDVNEYYSRDCFRCIKRHIHLWPLWSAVLQGNLERFTDSDVEVDHVPCRSNSAVESYFKSVKHSRMGHSTRLRASDFVLRQLEYVQGKANELSLPPQLVKKLKAQKSTSHALDLSSVSWRKRKRSKLYHSKPTRTEAAGSLFSEGTPVHKEKRATTASEKVPKRPDNGKQRVKEESKQQMTMHRRLHEELDDEDIERHMRLLRNKFPHIHLEATVLGTCVKNVSAPMFTAVPLGEKFVQPLNVGDHWITATNVLSDDDNEVQLFDSMFRNINESTVVQCTNLLRLHESSDTITFSLRHFAQQTTGTRICGHFAVAAMIALCHGVDVSAHEYDENVLVNELENNVQRGVCEVIDCVPTSAEPERLRTDVWKKWCICHRETGIASMVMCDGCRNWFHIKCVERRSPKITPFRRWSCPGCTIRKRK